MRVSSQSRQPINSGELQLTARASDVAIWAALNARAKSRGFQDAIMLDWRNVLSNVMLQIDIRKMDRGRYEPVARGLQCVAQLLDTIDERPVTQRAQLGHVDEMLEGRGYTLLHFVLQLLLLRRKYLGIGRWTFNGLGKID